MPDQEDGWRPSRQNNPLPDPELEQWSEEAYYRILATHFEERYYDLCRRIDCAD